MNNLQLSPHGLELIRRLEGERLTAYRDSVGVWTIGVGHTAGVREGQRITAEQSAAFLRADTASAAAAVNTMVGPRLNQNQFDALVSFVFNVGAGAFHRSTMLRKLNDSDWAGASAEFPRWNRPPELAGRRRLERALFDTPSDEEKTLVMPSRAADPGEPPLLAPPAQSPQNAAGPIAAGTIGTGGVLAGLSEYLPYLRDVSDFITHHAMLALAIVGAALLATAAVWAYRRWQSWKREA